jgi:hypothetical protein
MEEMMNVRKFLKALLSAYDVYYRTLIHYPISDVTGMTPPVSTPPVSTTPVPTTSTAPVTPPATRGAWLMRGLRRVAAFVCAAAVMVVLGSAAHSYFVQRAWSIAAGQADGGAPAAIPFGDRIEWAAHDLAVMFGGYATLTSVALCLAFFCAGALARFTGGRSIVFGAAGAAAVLVMFKLARLLLGTVGIFGARGAGGLAAQMAVGLIAGLVFARLTASSAKTARYR